MAIRKYVGDKITGLSSDSKPSNVSDGATFYETDTQKEYLRVSGAWVQLHFHSTTDTSTATPTPTGDRQRNFYTLTALATNATFAAPSGTPVNGNMLLIRYLDNGTARTLGYNAIYRAVGITLPTTTVINKTGYILAVYNSASSTWDCISTGVQA